MRLIPRLMPEILYHVRHEELSAKVCQGSLSTRDMFERR